jgi:hypothetical protein
MAVTWTGVRAWGVAADPELFPIREVRGSAAIFPKVTAPAEIVVAKLDPPEPVTSPVNVKVDREFATAGRILWTSHWENV